MTDKQLAAQCVQMLEKYLDDARRLPNDNTKTLTLHGSDMTDWKDTYYPQLSRSGKIRDGIFFQNPLKDLRYGIGNDGACTKLEYFQFLWSAYQFILGDFEVSNAALMCIKSCIAMLEPYAAEFENRGTSPGVACTLRVADLEMWKSTYYPALMAASQMIDAARFGGDDAAPDPVGEGRFAGEDLCYLLYRLYRLAKMMLD